MVTLTQLKTGSIGLIQEQENGDICQIGLSPEQSEMLQGFLAIMSKQSKLVMMPKEYNLKLDRE